MSVVMVVNYEVRFKQGTVGMVDMRFVLCSKLPSPAVVTNFPCYFIVMLNPWAMSRKATLEHAANLLLFFIASDYFTMLIF